MSDSTYHPKVYRKQGGDEFVIAYGGLLTREDSAGTGMREPSASLPGAVVAGKCTAAEYCDAFVHKTVLTLTLTGANDVDLADSANNSKGVKIYDFPAGRILILGAIMDGSVTVNNAFNASTNDVFYLSCGSADATQAADGDLTGTEADIIPKTTLDTVSNTTLTLDFDAALATSAQWASPLDLYFNAAVLDASTTKAVTVAATGTLTLYWINLG
jgi:hypothetical protein